MTDMLKCQVESCIYNRKEHCGATCIRVMGDNVQYSEQTFCGTYAPRSSVNVIAQMGHVNDDMFKSGVTQLREEEHMTPMVDCDVESCCYNGSGRCHAEQVDVARIREDSDPYCSACKTFRRG